MKFPNIYKWFAGNDVDFCIPFRDNEVLYKQARTFCAQLDKQTLIFIVLFIIVSLMAVCYYYIGYNNRPGRHYTPKHWLYFFFGTFALTFVSTLMFEYFAVEPKLSGALVMEFKIALLNSVYAIGLFLIISFFWCQFNWPTNAYRLFKISRKS